MNIRSIHFIALLSAFLVGSAASRYASGTPPQPRTIWVGSWAASQQIPEPANALPADALHDITLRQVVHLSIGGKTLRVHLSNAFGAQPMRLTSVHIATPLNPASSSIKPMSDRTLQFHGADDVIIPPGAEFLSDPIEYPVAALSDLTVTLHYVDLPDRQTGHPGSRATTYIAHGDLPFAEDLPDAKKIEHWYVLSGVDVSAPAGAYAVVTLGDSITDGHAAGTDKNERWPDILAQRLHNAAATRDTAVLNQGIGGNHMLTDGLGPNVLARFDRDVLAQPSARVVILLEGVNDLGGLARQAAPIPEAHDVLVQRLIASYEQVIERAHAQGFKVIGATITPYVGSDYYHPNAASEDDRQKLNTWIRATGHFDAVIDFDRAVRDPEHPDRMLPDLDSGDHLHPSPAGYKVMADSIPLNLLTPLK